MNSTSLEYSQYPPQCQKWLWENQCRSSLGGSLRSYFSGVKQSVRKYLYKPHVCYLFIFFSSFSCMNRFPDQITIKQFFPTCSFFSTTTGDSLRVSHFIFLSSQIFLLILFTHPQQGIFLYKHEKRMEGCNMFRNSSSLIFRLSYSYYCSLFAVAYSLFFVSNYAKKHLLSFFLTFSLCILSVLRDF